MYPILVVLGVFIIVIAMARGLKDLKHGTSNKKTYTYTRKEFFLSKPEHECFDALTAAVGAEFHIFAQVHLPTILDNKIVGQHWDSAFKHINGKSVDFVLCDKERIAPVLAIELDDSSHERPDRIERDGEVERICAEAGLPLLRLKHNERFAVDELREKVQSAIGTNV